MKKKARKGTEVLGERCYPEMLLVDGKEPDVSWTSRRLAMEQGMSDDVLSCLGSEDIVTLTNRELDRLKMVTEQLETLFETARVQGLEIGFVSLGSATGVELDAIARLRRWVVEVR